MDGRNSRKYVHVQMDNKSTNRRLEKSKMALIFVCLVFHNRRESNARLIFSWVILFERRHATLFLAFFRSLTCSRSLSLSLVPQIEPSCCPNKYLLYLVFFRGSFNDFLSYNRQLYTT